MEVCYEKDRLGCSVRGPVVAYAGDGTKRLQEYLKAECISPAERHVHLQDMQASLKLRDSPQPTRPRLGVCVYKQQERCRLPTGSAPVMQKNLLLARLNQLFARPTSPILDRLEELAGLSYSSGVRSDLSPTSEHQSSRRSIGASRALFLSRKTNISRSLNNYI
jgi:hypothetical protein